MQASTQAPLAGSRCASAVPTVTACLNLGLSASGWTTDSFVGAFVVRTSESRAALSDNRSNVGNQALSHCKQRAWFDA
jgi:hypothetical protein